MLLKQPDKKGKITSLSLSIIIHIIILIIFLVIKIELDPGKKPEYLSVDLREYEPEKPDEEIEKEEISESRDNIQIPEAETLEIESESKEDKTEELIDTTYIEKEDLASDGEIKDSIKKDFAAVLLDSFLTRHPEYARFILQQQAKNLVQDKNNKLFSRLELEKQINDKLDKYLQQHFPEGSQHEINKYTGPGFQIPLDGLIDSIKDLFK